MNGLGNFITGLKGVLTKVIIICLILGAVIALTIKWMC